MLKKINFNLEDIKNWSILDSGATSHFLVTDASATGISVATNPVTVTIPDGSKLTSTHKRELDLPQLPKAARSGHVIPGILAYSLMSVVTLCNSGCKIVFEAWGIGVTVTYSGTIVLEGKSVQKQACGWSLSPNMQILKKNQILLEIAPSKQIMRA